MTNEQLDRGNGIRSDLSLLGNYLYKIEKNGLFQTKDACSGEEIPFLKDIHERFIKEVKGAFESEISRLEKQFKKL